MTKAWNSTLNTTSKRKAHIYAALRMMRKYFKHAEGVRCILCRKPYEDIHHIKRQSGETNLKAHPANVIPVCRKHHDLIGRNQQAFDAMVSKYMPKRARELQIAVAEIEAAREIGIPHDWSVDTDFWKTAAKLTYRKLYNALDIEAFFQAGVILEF